jgi:membrane-associated HD superfamily phosphohydrolase
MASNKLFEAAAEILAGSKKSASAMPTEKLPAEVHDAGGPTPQNYKNDDNSAKITPSSKSATAPTTKPSDASAKMEEEQLEGEVIAEKMHDDEKKEMMKKKMKEDIDSLFADDSTISEEFKSKVSTIFEARVQDRLSQIEEETETRYASMLEEAIDTIKSDLTEKVDDYLSYVVEQWMEDNQIAIESGLRSEITEEFISGLRNLFAEHYIDVPAEKVDLVDELATKVEELEASLNEEIERGIQTKKSLVEARVRSERFKKLLSTSQWLNNVIKSNKCVGNCGRNDEEGYDKMKYRNKEIDLCRNCFVNYNEKLENTYNNIKQKSMFVDD